MWNEEQQAFVDHVTEGGTAIVLRPPPEHTASTILLCIRFHETDKMHGDYRTLSRYVLETNYGWDRGQTIRSFFMMWKYYKVVLISKEEADQLLLGSKLEAMSQL